MKHLSLKIHRQENGSVSRTLVLLLLFAVLAPVLAFPQFTIKGKISDRKQDLPFVNVSLLTADSTQLKETLTDVNGQFSFDNITPGQYLVSSTMIGYSKFYTSYITVKDSLVVLPGIILQESVVELNEMIIKAEKPVIEQQIDRLVVNVQKSITSAGSTVLDILQKSPGVVVNKPDNNIILNGRPGVKVMINGKILQMPLSAVIPMLDGMPAANVEKVELITAPPSKYDADGSAGIIHIIMKGSAELGTNGSVGLLFGSKWAETLGGNINLHHRSKEIAWFFDYSILRDHNKHISRMITRSVKNGFNQIITDNSDRPNITTEQNLNAGLEWKISNKTLLSIGITGYIRDWEMKATNVDNDHVASDSVVITNMSIDESNIWQSGTAGIGLQTSISAKSEISFNLDYLYYHNSNPSTYDNRLSYQPQGHDEVSNIDLKKTTPIHFWIARTDYQYHYSPLFTLEAGAKMVTSGLDNNVLVQRLTNNVWATDPEFTSYSTLREQVAAFYVSSKLNTASKWQINGGLRYEYTRTSISTPDQHDLINRKYGYLFPAISMNKAIGEGKDIQFSYSKRLTRPTYNDIAPFVFFWGPGIFSAGNTSLYPAISDAIKVGYHVKQWIVSMQFSHSKNEIAFLQPEKDNQTGSVIYRSQNMKYLNTVSLTGSISFTITSWWKIQNNLTGQYQLAETKHLQHNQKLHVAGFTMNIVNLLKLPKEFTVEISGNYRSKLLTGISGYLSAGAVNAGIQKKMGDRGVLRLAIDDIFNTNYWKIKTYLPENNLDSYFYYNLHNRYARMTYSWNFGNNKFRSVKITSGADEEKKRVNN